MRKLCVLALMLTSTVVFAQDRGAMTREADKAVAEERWCDALYYYLKLDYVQHDPKNIFNAAELARAAGDLVQARIHYKDLVARDPTFSEVPAAEQAIKELDAEIASKGIGTPCKDPEPICGNGVQERGELCDDGNTNDGDHCVDVCRRVPVCGDTILDAGEACDDGNRSAGDGCNASCGKEQCGNAVVDAGEQCDDGNANSGDGCSATCQSEAATVPLTTTPTQTSPPIEDQPRDIERDPPKKPSGGMSPVVGWSVLGGGVVLSVVGAVTSVIGLAPMLSYNALLSDRERAQANAEDAQSADDITAAADDVSDLDARMQDEADSWNDFGRFALPGGFALAVVGAAAAIGGGFLLATAGPQE